MSRVSLAVLLPFAIAFAGAATAQTTANPACAKTEALKSQSSQPSTMSMAATSSDMGNKGVGASSMAMGTGSTEKNGVMSPCAPTTTGQGATGATPPSTP